MPTIRDFPGNAVIGLCLAAAVPASAQAPDTLLHAIPAPFGTAQTGTLFGHCVAVDGALAVIGSPGEDQDVGVVRVFDTAKGALLHVIHKPGTVLGGSFGWSVAVSGQRVVVGTPRDDTGAYHAGSASVYDLSSATPAVPVAVLKNPAPQVDDNFGYSVAISGTRVVVGTPNDDASANDAGSAYAYDLSSTTPAIPVATLRNPAPVVNNHFGLSVAISGVLVVAGEYWGDTQTLNGGSVMVFDLAAAAPAVPIATLHKPLPAYNDHFGFSVAISGTRVVVGAFGNDAGASDAGSAYIYDVSGAAPTVPLFSLHNPEPAPGEAFGWAVAISGLRVVVGAIQNDVGLTNSGSAYVYNLSSSTVPVAILNNPAPGADDYFGAAVAISGISVLVGAPWDDTAAVNAGSAYVYDLTSPAPTVPVTTLSDPSPGTGENFGSSVAVSGARMVAGAPADDTGASNSGSVHVFDLSSDAPATPVLTVSNPEPAADDLFGSAVAISGAYMVVGAFNDNTGAHDSGSVYVYDLDSATPHLPIATLHNPAPAFDDRFGYSVAISGTRVLVGVPYDDTWGFKAGSVYVYELNSATPAVPVAVLGERPVTGPGFFGFSVAISGSRAVAGARGEYTGAFGAGSAFVYDLAGAGFTAPVLTLNNPSPGTGDSFGYPVAISGKHVVVAAPYDDTGATDAGSVYLYDLDSRNPGVPVAALHNPTPETFDNFGSPVAISGTHVVVGASADDTRATDAGSVYVYEFGSATPAVPVATLHAPGPAAGDNFGFAVSMDGATVAIGIPFDDSAAMDKGSACVFGSDLTPLQAWRQQHFGTIANSGHAADSFDYDKDGLTNLTEFAFKLDPVSGGSLDTPAWELSNGAYALNFTQSQGVSGITYHAEWSSALSGNWIAISDTGTPPQHIYRLSLTDGPRVFVRLRVSAK